jgi:hypothetical protein
MRLPKTVMLGNRSGCSRPGSIPIRALGLEMSSKRPNCNVGQGGTAPLKLAIAAAYGGRDKCAEVWCGFINSTSVRVNLAAKSATVVNRARMNFLSIRDLNASRRAQCS